MGFLLFALALLGYAVLRKSMALDDRAPHGSTAEKWLYWSWQAHGPWVQTLGAGVWLLVFASAADGGHPISGVFGATIGSEVLMWVLTTVTVTGRDVRRGVTGSVEIWHDTRESRHAWVEAAAARLGDEVGELRAALATFIASWWAYSRKWGERPDTGGSSYDRGRSEQAPNDPFDPHSSTSGSAGSRDRSGSSGGQPPGGSNAHSSGPSPFSMLGVQEGATWEEIHAAWRRLARELHPDANVGVSSEQKAKMQDRLKLVNEAYDVLRRRKAA